MSRIRQAVFTALEKYAGIIRPNDKGWDVLEVGIAGDPKPGGNFLKFGQGNNYKTLDLLREYDPDIVADICDTKLEALWDLIILSQTLEHVKYPHKAIKECFRLLRNGGYLIVDIPFQWEYHAEPQFDDYWRASHKGLRLWLEEAGFTIKVISLLDDLLATALVRKELNG